MQKCGRIQNLAHLYSKPGAHLSPVFAKVMFTCDWHLFLPYALPVVCLQVRIQMRVLHLRLLTQCYVSTRASEVGWLLVIKERYGLCGT